MAGVDLSNRTIEKLFLKAMSELTKASWGGGK